MTREEAIGRMTIREQTADGETVETEVPITAMTFGSPAKRPERRPPHAVTMWRDADGSVHMTTTHRGEKLTEADRQAIRALAPSMLAYWENLKATREEGPRVPVTFRITRRSGRPPGPRFDLTDEDDRHTLAAAWRHCGPVYLNFRLHKRTWERIAEEYGTDATTLRRAFVRAGYDRDVFMDTGGFEPVA